MGLPPDPGSTTTATLCDRWRSGRREAFPRLYGRVLPALRMWSSLRVPAGLRARLDPEDLIQEVWYRAVAGFGDFDPARGSFRSWVFGIAGNVLRMELRSLGRRQRSGPPRSLDSLSAGEQAADWTSASRKLARSEEFERVLAAAEALDEDSRRLLLFRGLEGLSHREVGERLGIGEAAAQQRWQRLRARLRLELLPPTWFED
ncbi:MAG: sigma-70 family RNA polymerase sigma factor [Planctomycetota bacterium]